MTPREIESALKIAFDRCKAEGLPLQNEQMQILLQSAIAALGEVSEPQQNGNGLNPLDALTPEQRQALLAYVETHNDSEQSWKARLLDDWLDGRDSGSVQFLRELFGVQWLEQVQPYHLAQYSQVAAMTLQVGDRIEVSNNLWEWVQDEGPCSREWVACTVISLSTTSAPASPTLPESYSDYTNCIIRFDNGVEYEIQGIYEWNRYNWRWLGEN